MRQCVSSNSDFPRGEPLRIEVGTTIISQGGMMEMAMGAPKGTKIFPAKAHFAFLSTTTMIYPVWVFKDSFGTLKCEISGTKEWGHTAGQSPTLAPPQSGTKRANSGSSFVGEWIGYFDYGDGNSVETTPSFVYTIRSAPNNAYLIHWKSLAAADSGKFHATYSDGIFVPDTLGAGEPVESSGDGTLMIRGAITIVLRRKS